ncbi:MAG: sigma-70 family RNA polymerase sigma factor [Myxococcales bacterium]|nr:sigma-70 family RNA polymerase sigma factor [Myxococcales bacterium]
MAIDVHHSYQRYGPMVLRRCRVLLREEQKAEDAMHDVFVRLLSRSQDLAPTGLSSLLYRMATQVCLNRMRSERRHPEHPGDALLLHIAAQDDTEGATGARELLARLFGAEPVSSRVIAVLHLHDGMTLAEVAEATGMSVSGVRKRLRSMRTKLERLQPKEQAA